MASSPITLWQIEGEKVKVVTEFIWGGSKIIVDRDCIHEIKRHLLLGSLCNPMDCGPPGSSVHGILQARMLEWVAILFSRGSYQPRDQTQVSCIAGSFFTIWATREAHERPSGCVQLLQLYLTLWDSMDYSLPGSSVHEILQARIQEWVATFSSRGSSPSRNQIQVSYTAGRFFNAEPLGKPWQT